jgi:branched-chain amino acid transport system permease protein
MLPTFDDLKPFVAPGLALGGVYAMSGVALVVLYRSTGVLNLAFGAIGAMGALISWTLINHTSFPEWASYLVCIGFGGLVTLAYGLVFGPPLARRDPLVKAVGTLGLALILLGIMSNEWPPQSRSMLLPTSTMTAFTFSGVGVNWTQIMGFGFGVVVTALIGTFLRFTRLGTAMRALADDREITATLGVPVRRVEATAWLGSGLLAGAAGLLLSNLIALDAPQLTFLVISVLAAALIGRLRSLVVTLAAGMLVGLVYSLLNPVLEWPNTTYSIANFRGMSPFVLAIIALLWLARRRVVTIGRTGAK